MSRKCGVTEDLRVNIMRIVACQAEPVSNDFIAYKLGMAKKTVREATLKLFNEQILDRMKMTTGRREWRYYLASSKPVATTPAPEHDVLAVGASA